MKRALVVCIGNALVADDAAGVLVYEELMRHGLPGNTSAVLLGTRGIALLDELFYEDLLVVVDAVRLGARPGVIHVMECEDLDKADGMPVTSHDIGLREILAVGRRLFPERMPSKIMLVGVEGTCFDEVRSAPTAPVANAVPYAAKTVLSLLYPFDSNRVYL